MNMQVGWLIADQTAAGKGQGSKLPRFFVAEIKVRASGSFLSQMGWKYTKINTIPLHT